MKFITIALCFQFLLSCWPKTNVITKIRQQYGIRTLKVVRKLDKTYWKLKKLELDISFLQKCKLNNLVPNFCKVKPANKRGLTRKELISLQNKVLSLELDVKYRTRAQCGKVYKDLLLNLRTELSFITYISVLQLIKSNAERQCKLVSVRHASKISSLNHKKDYDVSVLELDKIVVNLSSGKFSDTELHILSRGLDFSVTPQHLDRLDIQASFESLYQKICAGNSNSTFSRFKQRLRSHCYTYIYGFRKDHCSNLSPDELKAFKSLKQRSDI